MLKESAILHFLNVKVEHLAELRRALAKREGRAFRRSFLGLQNGDFLLQRVGRSFGLLETDDADERRHFDQRQRPSAHREADRVGSTQDAAE